MRFRIALFASLFFIAPITAQEILPGVKKIVFLGDSITHGGQYISFFETQLRLREPNRAIEILNLGLPSETVSGLSEEGHAGGKFPRPDLHERLGRVLAKTRPDLVVACYGMNDGIYLPLDTVRFEKYKDGLARLRDQAGAAKAKIIYLTPPVFDPLPIKARLAPADKVDANHAFEGYGEVLDRYSDWLLAQRNNGWTVVDVHGPMKAVLASERIKNPKFAFAADGVHPNLDGQLMLGEAFCRGMGLEVKTANKEVKNAATKAGQLFKLIDQRSRLLRDAWLSDIGHKRPLSAGLPLEKAQAKAAEITAAIDKLLP